MGEFAGVLWVEWRKAIRSRMPIWTCLGSLFMPVGMACILLLAKNPELSRNLGLIGAKADLTAYAATDWISYLVLFGQIVAVGGYFFFVLAISWVFGREFADGTLKDTLAVPVRRSSIVLAKFCLTAAWCGAIALVILITGLLMGGLLRLPGGSMDTLLARIGVIVIAAAMMIAAVLPFAFLASAGRGYLLPLGVAVLTLIAANLLMVVGWAEYFPWAVPMLYAQGESELPAASYWIVLLTGAGGMIATYLWWKLADQSR